MSIHDRLNSLGITLPHAAAPVASYQPVVVDGHTAFVSGQLPFVDLWDRKPFGLFLLFGLADASGLPAPWSYQLFATIFIVLGALLLRRLALLLVDTTTAGVLAVLYIVLMTIYGSHSAQTEIYHVPAMLGMALLVRDTSHPEALKRACIAMAIGGVALQVKYTVVPQCLF